MAGLPAGQPEPPANHARAIGLSRTNPSTPQNDTICASQLMINQ
jgi:hypothetical protein